MKPLKTSAVLLSIAAAGFILAGAAYAEESETAAGWFTDDSGKRFYRNDDGSVAVGTVEIDGVPYVFAPNGVQQLGWQTVNDLRYYYDAAGAPVFGWLNWRGEKYYITKDSGKLTADSNYEGVNCALDQYGAALHGWEQNEKKQWLYRNEYGVSLTNCTETIDGTEYAFDADGVLLTGWQTVNGITRYYEPDTRKSLNGWVTLNDKTYYIDANHGLLTGLQTVEGKDCYFDAEGAQQFGFLTLPDGTTHNFLEPKGSSHGLTAINGYLYFFDDKGVQQKGFVKIGDNTHYFGDEDGRMMFDFQTIEGKLYYFDPYGIMYRGAYETEDGVILFADDGSAGSGFRTFDGKTYLCDEAGRILSGVRSVDEKSYYLDADGILQTGWFEIDGAKYHADENGVLSVGETVVDEKEYYFSKTGMMLTGVVQMETCAFLYGDDGLRCGTGMQTFRNALYFCGVENGELISGFQTFEDGIHYFNPDFTMQIGWGTIGESAYYFDANGVMLTGKQTIDQNEYTFSDEGVLQSALLIRDDSAALYDENGKPVTGWYTLNGAKYYCENAGEPVKGWKSIENHSYYFYNKNYQMAVSTTVESFVIDENGVARTENAVSIDDMLPDAGSTPKSMFKYFVARYKYRRNESTRSYSQITNAGWDTLITYLLKNKRGVCYYLAATYDYLCQRAGYTTRLVHATHDTGNHYWVQVKINDSWHNFDPTYSSRNDISWSQQIALGNYTVLGFVKLVYDNRGALTEAQYTPYS